MSPELKDLCKFRLEQARESLNSSKKLFDARDLRDSLKSPVSIKTD